MADGLFPKRKPLTKEDIQRLRETLPKKVETKKQLMLLPFLSLSPKR